MTTALLTDHYELTMVQAALDAGTADRHSLFDLFTRRLPEGRRYGVLAGLGRVLRGIESFRFEDPEIAYLLDSGIIKDNLATWLADFRFTGDIWGYPEGEVFFPGSPVLSVEGSFAECCVLETLLLSIYNHDCAIASAASRMTSMAGGRPCSEMGSRRTHEWAAVGAARAAYVAGFAATSNLEAGRSWGIPTMGTAAHSFTLLHDTEEHAFRAQLDSLGDGTTLLVDTYDEEAAIRKGVELTEGRLGAIRLDSGDLVSIARRARDLLDDLGATDTRIVVTSDLDEWQIAALSGTPVDGYGVGTSLVTGSGHPTVGFVYKLVARAESADPNAPMTPVGKKSKGKNTLGGASLRCVDWTRKAVRRPRSSGWVWLPKRMAMTATCSSTSSRAARWSTTPHSRTHASATSIPWPNYRPQHCGSARATPPSRRSSWIRAARRQPIPTRQPQTGQHLTGHTTSPG